MMAPAARRRATAGASSSGTWPARTREPHAAGIPRTSIVSFTVRGTPWSAPRASPRATVASAARACSSASGASATTAFRRGLTLSTRRRYDSTASTGETARARIRRASSAADSWVSSSDSGAALQTV
jgi:hypothetical protein